MLDKINLEKLLLKHWTEFLDVRKMIEFVNLNNYDKVNKITLSRFTPYYDGFLIWIEFNYQENTETKKGMIEALLTFNNEILLLDKN